MMQNPTIAGFWSYAQQDDTHENGRITRLRERLEQSVRFYSGIRDFRIFQDRKDIGWGETWSSRISNSIDDALVLFSVITPSYFTSSGCKEEVVAFQRRQNKLGRDDLILPIYYLNAPSLESPQLEEMEAAEREIADLFRARQREDWRALRETPESDPAYAKAVERLAERAAQSLKRGRNPSASTEPPSPPNAKTRVSVAQGSSTSATDPAEIDSTPNLSNVESAPGHVFTVTVSPMPGRAQFTSVAEAVARAPGGARILVAPGHYRENISIDKPLELIGDGPLEDIVIESSESEPIIFDTNIGVVRNLTLRQTQSKAEDYCIWIQQGRLELEDCDISSSGKACIGVMNGADPRVRRNKIHNSQTGIIIYRNGRGTYEENEIFSTKITGIDVLSVSEPTCRRNRIYDSESNGIIIRGKSRGVFEDNEIFRNRKSGVRCYGGSNPIVRRNLVHNNLSCGISIGDDSSGTFEENEIYSNSLAGVELYDKSNPVFRGNKIRDGRQGGVFIHSGGLGVFEDNHIYCNNYAGVEVKEDGNPTFIRNLIFDGKQSGVYVHEGGSGRYEENQIYGNNSQGIFIKDTLLPTFMGNSISNNVQCGVSISKAGGGRFEENILTDQKNPWRLAEGTDGNVVRLRNRE